MSDASRGTAGDVDALHATGAAGAGESSIEHAGAVEPSGDSLLSAVLRVVQSQVPQSAERERVLGAGRLLVSGVTQATVRSLAGKWGVRQKVGGKNRGTSDTVKEIEETVTRAATRLLQQEEGSDAVALTEPTADASSGQSSDQRLMASVELGVAAEASGRQRGNEAVVLRELAADAQEEKAQEREDAEEAHGAEEPVWRLKKAAHVARDALRSARSLSKKVEEGKVTFDALTPEEKETMEQFARRSLHVEVDRANKAYGHGIARTNDFGFREGENMCLHVPIHVRAALSVLKKQD